MPRSLEKQPNRKPLNTDIINNDAVTSTERFSVTKDISLKGDNAPLTSHKSKKKLYTHKTKQSSLAIHGSIVSMHSGKSHERTSGLSNNMELEKRLNLLRTDTNELRKSRKKLEHSGSEDDSDQDEERHISEIEADSETDSEASMDKDYMEKLADSFRKSAIYLERKISRPDIDFFETLGEIPDIEDISLEDSIWESDMVLHTQASIKKFEVDSGKFVDPLTGIEIKSTSSSTPDIQPQPEVSEHSIELEDSADLLGEIKFEEDEDIGQIDKADEDKDEIHDDIIFGKWLHSIPSKGSVTDEFAKDVYDAHKRKYILDFVTYLINNVVHAVEMEDPNRIFGKALDKKKLVEDLDDKLKELQNERNQNQLLNKAAVEFLRRKGDNRGLKADHPDQIKQLIDKNAELQESLYELLYREEEIKNLSSIKISNLTAEVEAAEMVANQSVDTFEKIIKKTFCRDRFQYLNEVNNVEKVYYYTLHTLSFHL